MHVFTNSRMLNYRYVFATAIIIFGSSFQFGFQTGVINSPSPVKSIPTFYRAFHI